MDLRGKGLGHCLKRLGKLDNSASNSIAGLRGGEIIQHMAAHRFLIMLPQKIASGCETLIPSISAIKKSVGVLHGTLVNVFSSTSRKDWVLNLVSCALYPPERVEGRVARASMMLERRIEKKEEIVRIVKIFLSGIVPYQQKELHINSELTPVAYFANGPERGNRFHKELSILLRCALSCPWHFQAVANSLVKHIT
ncbi:uncharacterized protein BDR25DRAFT_355644 [Lindgomyces ingoldianus]|uniref:Uncharacterized protein n=1 Tax=Lindgomyces ingoldianus TaxID=673940 RepID=A0ACB6QWU1_9PLEO|nr:uncharacterized protein BDR25DRAFT_355644 [Lindgomyces ingoldianus]KAF2470542.1 hypothetical protein BDR25DRAFT_355644 [Lindgomyces ingoldianus]